MESAFWSVFLVATSFKTMLIPAYHSTDFEVHRNWLAITHSLPLSRWYIDATSEWTLDYPPFFAYFEWLLAQFAQHVDPQMLLVHNINYASEQAKLFQRGSVIILDIVFAFGVWRCMRALRISIKSHQHFIAEILLLLNVGLLFVDHIHFQYNGLLLGVLLLSISFLLEERYLLSAFTYATLLNLKHIFLYMAPVFAVYYLKFYCLDAPRRKIGRRMLRLAGAGLVPFVLSLGPFWQQLPQVFRRLFPFKRGLTHAYWAPNFWALYNTADKVATVVLRVRDEGSPSSTSGLVQEIKHVVLPTVTPLVTFVLTVLFMLPIASKLLFYTNKRERKLVFLRGVVLCSCAAFMFGWHVHEKAILMCLIPLCLLCILNAKDAKFCLLLSVPGYFSLFPLLFHPDLIILRYSLFLGYILTMYSQCVRLYKNAYPSLNMLEFIYFCGFAALPVYEHALSPLLGLQTKLPFMPLLLTSVYCSLGISYFFISYYIYTMRGFIDALIAKFNTKPKNKKTSKKKRANRQSGSSKPKSVRQPKTKLQ